MLQAPPLECTTRNRRRVVCRERWLLAFWLGRWQAVVGPEYVSGLQHGEQRFMFSWAVGLAREVKFWPQPNSNFAPGRKFASHAHPVPSVSIVASWVFFSGRLRIGLTMSGGLYDQI